MLNIYGLVILRKSKNVGPESVVYVSSNCGEVYHHFPVKMDEETEICRAMIVDSKRKVVIIRKRFIEPRHFLCLMCTRMMDNLCAVLEKDY